MKLATELSKRDTGRTFYILDEPTTGLHFEDVRVLLDVLHRLVDRGNTVLVIEHNLDVIKTADWIIDLGPEGGNRGGTIVAAGTPEDVAAVDGVVHGPLHASARRPEAAESGLARQTTGVGQGATKSNARTAAIRAKSATFFVTRTIPASRHDIASRTSLTKLRDTALHADAPTSSARTRPASFHASYVGVTKRPRRSNGARISILELRGRRTRARRRAALGRRRRSNARTARRPRETH